MLADSCDGCGKKLITFSRRRGGFAGTAPARESHFAGLRVWNYDGSSTEQADGNNSEVYLYPKAIFKACAAKRRPSYTLNPNCQTGHSR